MFAIIGILFYYILVLNIIFANTILGNINDITINIGHNFKHCVGIYIWRQSDITLIHNFQQSYSGSNINLLTKFSKHAFNGKNLVNILILAKFSMNACAVRSDSQFNASISWQYLGWNLFRKNIDRKYAKEYIEYQENLKKKKWSRLEKSE